MTRKRAIYVQNLSRIFVLFNYLANLLSLKLLSLCNSQVNTHNSRKLIKKFLSLIQKGEQYYIQLL